jgi:hypothetical protein
VFSTLLTNDFTCFMLITAVNLDRIPKEFLMIFYLILLGLLEILGLLIKCLGLKAFKI